MNPDALKHAIEQIEMDETMQARVLRRSLDHRKEHEPMKKKPRIAIVAVAAAAVMALSVTAFAAIRNQVQVIWTDAGATIDTLSEAQEALAGTGSKLTLPQALPGGYAFKNAQISHQMTAEEQDAEDIQNVQTLEGEDGIVFSFVGDTGSDGVACTYDKDGETVLFDASKLPMDMDCEGCDIVEKNGVTFYCCSGETVSVSSVAVEDGDLPEDFDPAGPDLSAMDVDTQTGTYRSVCWTVDGITYTLSQTGGSLTQDDLLEMAAELCGT